MENSKMLKLSVKQLFTILFSILLVGCAGREDMEISKAVFDKPSYVVITQISGLDRPTYGYVSEGFSYSVKPFIRHSGIFTLSGREQIQSIDAKPIVEEYYYKTFATSFEKKNFKTIGIHLF